MKRRVNDVPLGTIVGLLPGFTWITVEDRRACNRYCDNAEDTRSWSGYAKDIWDTWDEIRYKWMRTKVNEIRHTPKGLIILIQTEWEEY